MRRTYLRVIQVASGGFRLVGEDRGEPVDQRRYLLLGLTFSPQCQYLLQLLVPAVLADDLAVEHHGGGEEAEQRRLSRAALHKRLQVRVHLPEEKRTPRSNQQSQRALMMMRMKVSASPLPPPRLDLPCGPATGACRIGTPTSGPRRRVEPAPEQPGSSWPAAPRGTERPAPPTWPCRRRGERRSDAGTTEEIIWMRKTHKNIFVCGQQFTPNLFKRFKPGLRRPQRSLYPR